jgi:aminopeptidase N
MFFRVLPALLAIAACKKASDPPDPHSYARPDRVAVKDLALDLTVDFATKTLAGTAQLAIERAKPSENTLVLDTDGLAVESVTACEDKRALSHTFGSRTSIGRSLSITLGGASCVAIAYTTAPFAGALLWLDPSGTAGGQKPMLFTQSQAILARTWIPLQDTPSVRFTYRATIRVPAGFWALMSAENPTAYVEGGVWLFQQTRAIPSYLMALAVGDFAFRSTGPRTGVYAEPSVVDAAAAEFAEIEAMFSAAERLYGPYRWGRYDMLVLPPSFPYGGMENPNLTFLTPTVITGDRSLVSLVAHELAHSWSGNLVTNKTWNDFWLNEGFTTYVELRLMEELRGRETSDLMWHGVRRSLDDALAKYPAGDPASRLAHAIGRGTTPDDLPSDFAYDKGALFLRTLEHTYGREKLDAWLRGWFERHAFKSVDSKLFETEAREQLGTKVDLAAWIYKSGIPAGAAPTDSARAKVLEGVARDAAAGKNIDATGWTTRDWVVLIKALPMEMTLEQLLVLDVQHGLSKRNAEISMHWLPRLIRVDARGASAAVEKFLLEVGRRRMVDPVYEAMQAQNDFWRALAKTTFERAKPRYHSTTRQGVEEILAKKT